MCSTFGCPTCKPVYIWKCIFSTKKRHGWFAFLLIFKWATNYFRKISSTSFELEMHRLFFFLHFPIFGCRRVIYYAQYSMQLLPVQVWMPLLKHSGNCETQDRSKVPMSLTLTTDSLDVPALEQLRAPPKSRGSSVHWLLTISFKFHLFGSGSRPNR